ncbi:MAG: phage tail protein I [Betaproteobacteria bacterium]|nr:phage tail protein I [Betaproteobacteria bacterium]
MSDRLLPPNSTPIEYAFAGLAERLAPEIIATLWDVENCPAAALPWLAWELSVDEWDTAWDEATQRRVIAESIQIHRKKGTRGAVEQALACLGHTGKITEWWQMSPRGEPHTFIADVEVDNRGIDLDAQEAIERQIIAVKPARSHFAMRLIATSRGTISLGAVTLSGETVTIYPFIATEFKVPPALITIGAAFHSWETVTIYPGA